MTPRPNLPWSLLLLLVALCLGGALACGGDDDDDDASDDDASIADDDDDDDALDDDDDTSDDDAADDDTIDDDTADDDIDDALAKELEERAAAFNEWYNDIHRSPYGGMGYAIFATPELKKEEIVRFSFGDSTIWTGTYATAEAFRYAVTGDADAKASAIAAIHTLDTHLKITQVPGFIARFAGPDEAPWNNGYTTHDRYVKGTGDWEGSFWINNTSRDQYTGWFMGMATAYDLVDDEDLRELIREDVKLVIDKVVADDFTIIGEDDKPTDAGPKALSTFRLTWLLIAAHVLDDSYYWDLYESTFEDDKDGFALSNFSWFNKYDEYYGFNLSHENFYSLFRLETNAERRQFYLDAFNQQIRKLVVNTHNVFFDAIYLANCERAGGCDGYDETLDDMRVQIADFQDPPVVEKYLEVPEWPLDPISVFLSDLIDEWGIRELVDIEYQTKDARPVKWRCPRSFMWQKTPYTLNCDEGDGTEVYPGIDYMVAYWMMRYYDFISPGNPNDIYWPEQDDARR
ncbi:MAG: hypothetical protein H6683_07465 [Deltaproteobacteria bacterium]|nr:hypothetical protein [Deltaproteobacteria bacterium]